MKYSYDNLEMTVTYRKDKEIEIRVANHNTFRVGNITVTTEYAGKKRTEFIGRIEAHETWKSGDRTENIPPFHAASFYEGKEQIIDPGLYDEKSGVYRGEPFHALVWRDEEKRKTWQPALAKIPAVSQHLLCISNFDACPKDGSTARGRFSFTSSSTMR